MIDVPWRVCGGVEVGRLASSGGVAVAVDAGAAAVPGELRERVEVGDRGELRLLRPEADVAVVPVDEEVGGGAVDELVAGLGDVLPLGRSHALAVDVPGDGDLLEEDVLDPALVDLLPDLPDLLEPSWIVAGLLERRERIGDRPLRKHLLDLRRT